MRPLRLQVEGFTCFKERQELEFANLELFAITGPTGAGKSSLLDAILLALYGEVPREGDRYTELISHGREQRSEEHTSELQSQSKLVCRLLLENKKTRR